MTQPTIKEKVDELLNEYFITTKNTTIPEFVQRFARLICEEIKNNFNSPEDAITRRVVELTEREILKALE